MTELSHAYIVSSPSEEARESFALRLAQEMLCSSKVKRPCGVCRDCRKVLSGVHPDLARIEREPDDKGRRRREILVGQVRAMAADAIVVPNEARAKAYIISDADTMNEQAQNAALKLLEEPPRGVHFILCAANPERLLITVRSRCVLIAVGGAEEAEDADAAALAEEFMRLRDAGDTAGITAWCFGHDSLDAHALGEFLNALRSRLAGELLGQNKLRAAEDIRLVDRCLEYQTVNTGVKHILGLLAVNAAAETRKQID